MNNSYENTHELSYIMGKEEVQNILNNSVSQNQKRSKQDRSISAK